MASPEAILAGVAAILGVVVPGLVNLSANLKKDRDTERERLERRLEELEKSKIDLEERFDKVETELHEVKYILRNTTDFLHEIVANLHDLPGIIKKAQFLIDRMKGE